MTIFFLCQGTVSAYNNKEIWDSPGLPRDRGGELVMQQLRQKREVEWLREHNKPKQEAEILVN